MIYRVCRSQVRRIEIAESHERVFQNGEFFPLMQGNREAGMHQRRAAEPVFWGQQIVPMLLGNRGRGTERVVRRDKSNFPAFESWVMLTIKIEIRAVPGTWRRGIWEGFP